MSSQAAHSSSSSPSSHPLSAPQTAADHTTILNQIDRDVVKLLRSAGEALQALTVAGASDAQSSTTLSNSNLKNEEDEAERPASSRTMANASKVGVIVAPADGSNRREAFSSAVTSYFTLLSSIDVRLRKEIRALEAAHIILPATLAEQSGREGTASRKTATSSLGAGVGNLDIGVLNSRNDIVGRQLQAELWESAADMLEVMNIKPSLQAESKGKELDGDEVMQEVEMVPDLKKEQDDT